MTAFQAVDLNSGRVVRFNHTLPLEYVAKAIESSASIPGFFSPVKMNGLVMVDGGVFDNLGIAQGI